MVLPSETSLGLHPSKPIKIYNLKKPIHPIEQDIKFFLQNSKYKIDGVGEVSRNTGENASIVVLDSKIQYGQDRR